MFDRSRLGPEARARLATAHDVALAAATQAASRIALRYRTHMAQSPRTERVWQKTGVLPVPYHYYEPVVRVDQLAPDTWTREAPLEGIDLRLDAQVALLSELAPYASELASRPRMSVAGAPVFTLEQTNYGPGDADSLYAMVRLAKPAQVIEAGSGYSTLLVREACLRNAEEDHGARHTCVEPFEMPWLERLGIDVLRRPVESLDPGIFADLNAGDLLFIDSSHVVRTGGDVTYLILEVLPRLRPGVLVHFHDVFLPLHYPRAWVDAKRFWTEQYLLQAFLAFNLEFEVMLSLNYLAHHAGYELKQALPFVAADPACGPGAFWIRRVSDAGARRTGRDAAAGRSAT